jgi:hypothetical protein
MKGGKLNTLTEYSPLLIFSIRTSARTALGANPGYRDGTTIIKQLIQ